MKKMVCEICGSQSIRKENGVFVCQECGTEYSLEEAKNLLKEVDACLPNESQPEKGAKQVASEENKYVLLKKLSLWANYLSLFEKFQDFDFTTTNEAFWIKHDFSCIKSLIPSSYQSLEYASKFGENEAVKIFAESYIKENDNFDEYPFSARNAYKTSREQLVAKYDFNDPYLRCYKGQSVASAYPSQYQSKGFADEIVQNAYKDDFKKWCDYLVMMCADSTLDSSIYSIKTSLFGTSRKLIISFNPIAREVAGFLKSGHTSIKEKYESYYKDTLAPIVADRRRDLTNIIREEKTFVEVFPLPVKYRTFPIVIGLMELIYDGRAESWKEAINMYETDTFRKSVISILIN